MSQIDRTINSLDPIFHPASHYLSPEDVLDDAGLSIDEKRLILSSWASDMYVMESQPAFREVPGIPHKLRLDDILAALKRLDGDNGPLPRGGLALRRPRFNRLDCIASDAQQDVFEPAGFDETAAACEDPAHRRSWTSEANVRRYRKLLHTRLTDIERNFIERRFEELRGGESSDQPGTIGGRDDHARR
jgi:hypothetical protein